jgi:hypothetical protein
MDYKLYQNYIDARDTESSLLDQANKIRTQLSEAEKKLANAEGVVNLSKDKISPDSLLTSVSVKIINEILSRVRYLHIGLDKCSVSFAQLIYKNGNVRMDVVLAQPVFQGWKTEKPYISYWYCPLSVVTPSKPTENHIPKYTSVLGANLTSSCWECTDNSVVLYSRSGDSRIVFDLEVLAE